MVGATTKDPAWKIILKSKIFWASALLLVTGATLDNLNGQQLNRLFPARVPIPDTLFEILPYYQWTQGFSDLANVFSCLLLALYLFPHRWRKLPFALAVLGLGYTLRSILILLNPFGGPLGNFVHYGVTNIHQFGQFPSGHMFLVVAIYFILDQDDVPGLKKLALVSIIVEVLALLLSHGHYSIDIVGGWLVGYLCFHFLSQYHQQLVVEN